MVHEITTDAGTVYHVQKMRTEDSFGLSIYHWKSGYRWRPMSADTLAEVRTILNCPDCKPRERCKTHDYQ